MLRHQRSIGTYAHTYEQGKNFAWNASKEVWLLSKKQRMHTTYKHMPSLHIEQNAYVGYLLNCYCTWWTCARKKFNILLFQRESTQQTFSRCEWCDNVISFNGKIIFYWRWYVIPRYKSLVNQNNSNLIMNSAVPDNVFLNNIFIDSNIFSWSQDTVTYYWWW